eukprot:TRINITY_DN8032_c0_g1_i1.p1 TRINITY_DN8032_c0_g1~~TRINITY_DN8032_c0_g1_i1.p1  ORF type:complete len:160 (+),score=35.81 TRINITY_DN8032_c0_g1_i1:48-482(+)
MSAGAMAQRKLPPTVELPKISLKGAACHGWLEKQNTSQHIKKYSRRFFVLRGSHLTMYKKAGNVGINQDLKKWITCTEFDITGAQVFSGPDDDPKRLFKFTLNAKTDGYVLNAEDSATREKWINALTDAAKGSSRKVPYLESVI